MRIIKPCQIIFADDRVEKDFNDLSDNDEIKKWINRAKDDIKKNAFCGIPIPKKLIPKIYIQKYGINNLWNFKIYICTFNLFLLLASKSNLDGDQEP